MARALILEERLWVSVGKGLVQGLFKVTVFPKITVSQGTQELGVRKLVLANTRSQH